MELLWCVHVNEVQILHTCFLIPGYHQMALLLFLVVDYTLHTYHKYFTTVFFFYFHVYVSDTFSTYNCKVRYPVSWNKIKLNCAILTMNMTYPIQIELSYS